MKKGIIPLLAVLLFIPMAACGAKDSDLLAPVEYPSDEVIESAINGLSVPERTIGAGENEFIEEVAAFLLTCQKDGTLPEERGSAWIVRGYPDSESTSFAVAGARFNEEKEVRWYLVSADCNSIYSLDPAGSAELLWKQAAAEESSDLGSERAMGLLTAHIALPEGVSLLDYGTSQVNETDCYTIAAGENTGEKFTAEHYYYIPLDYSRIDRFDVLTTELVTVWSAN